MVYLICKPMDYCWQFQSERRKERDFMRDAHSVAGKLSRPQRPKIGVCSKRLFQWMDLQRSTTPA